ncbi:hypothetical protein QFC24_002051 [Naganishia onofrii]|uniref:Uncharacterized protein n=1 Tax=Naganishia onofrii TaxID=1851511 RepID=A0ACC2XS70_9TREE|nr:hypothetical protein QFC24_002051 [Naganishia onofrii]
MLAPFQNVPKIAAKIVFTGSKILGRALAEAGKQGVRNFKYKPEGADDTNPAGASGSTAGNSSQRLTSDLKMTLDEACLILNVKKDTPLEAVQKNYEHLFKANAPPEPPAAPDANAPPTRASRAARQSKPVYSHYLQSKVYRALERIKAEREGQTGEGGEGGEAAASTAAEGEAATAAPAAPEPPQEAPKSRELPGKGPTTNPNEPIQL